MIGSEFRKGVPVLEALASARSTIAEQEKRIAELTAERDNWERTAIGAEEQLIGAETALTTERQRREEAEAIVTLTCDLDRPFGRAAVEQARVRYFAKYEASNG